MFSGSGDDWEDLQALKKQSTDARQIQLKNMEDLCKFRNKVDCLISFTRIVYPIMKLVALP